MTNESPHGFVRTTMLNAQIAASTCRDASSNVRRAAHAAPGTSSRGHIVRHAIHVAHHTPSASTISRRYHDPADVSRNVPTKTPTAHSDDTPRPMRSRGQFPPHRPIPVGTHRDASATPHTRRPACHPAAISFPTPSPSRITHRRHRPFRPVHATLRMSRETSLQGHRPSDVRGPGG